MRMLFLIIPLCLSFSTIDAQCYTAKVKDGKAQLAKKAYSNALDIFYQANYCPDKPRQNDLFDLIKETQEQWVKAIEAEKVKSSRLLKENEANLERIKAEKVLVDSLKLESEQNLEELTAFMKDEFMDRDIDEMFAKSSAEDLQLLFGTLHNMNPNDLYLSSLYTTINCLLGDFQKAIETSEYDLSQNNSDFAKLILPILYTLADQYEEKALPMLKTHKGTNLTISDGDDEFSGSFDELLDDFISDFEDMDIVHPDFEKIKAFISN